MSLEEKYKLYASPPLNTVKVTVADYGQIIIIMGKNSQGMWKENPTWLARYCGPILVQIKSNVNPARFCQYPLPKR